MRTLTFNRVLGVGATGTVFLAELRVPGGFTRTCAVKVMKSSNPDQEQFRARMRDEARLLGMLQDEQILGVTELVEVDGHDCVVMEYVEGADLAELIGAPDQVEPGVKRERAKLPPRALAELGAELSGTLHRAHSAAHPHTGEPLKVIHRDVKPSNVMITARGGVRLLDFGAARAAFETRESNTQGLVLGTLNYFPPEIMAGAEPTPAVDVYGLGLSLWECASGLEWGTPQVHRHRFERRVESRLADLGPEYEPLVGILRRLLSWRPQDRPTGTQAEKLLIGAAEICAAPNLRAWARDRVPPILEKHRTSVLTDPFLGRTIEMTATESVRQAPPAASPPRPKGRAGGSPHRSVGGAPPPRAPPDGRPRGKAPPTPDATVPPRGPADPGAPTWIPGITPGTTAFTEAPTELSTRGPPPSEVTASTTGGGLSVDPNLGQTLAERRAATQTFNDLAPPAAVPRPNGAPPNGSVAAPKEKDPKSPKRQERNNRPVDRLDQPSDRPTLVTAASDAAPARSPASARPSSASSTSGLRVSGALRPPPAPRPDPAAAARSRASTAEAKGWTRDVLDTGPVPELPLDPTDEEDGPLASEVETTRLTSPTLQNRAAKPRPDSGLGLGRTFAWLSLSALLGIIVGTGVLVLLVIVTFLALS